MAVIAVGVTRRSSSLLSTCRCCQAGCCKDVSVSYETAMLALNYIGGPDDSKSRMVAPLLAGLQCEVTLLKGRDVTEEVEHRLADQFDVRGCGMRGRDECVSDWLADGVDE